MDDTATGPLGIDIEIDLDADPASAWAAVATPDGLAGWLAPRVDLPAVEPGVAGRVVDDDGASRRLCVREVEPGHRVTFTWWREDDPADASTVTLLLVPAGAGVTRLRVRETTALVGPRMQALAGVRLRAGAPARV